MQQADVSPETPHPFEPFVPDPLEAESLPERVKLQAMLDIERAVPVLLALGFVVFVFGSQLGPRNNSPTLVSSPTQIVVMRSGGGLMALAGLLWMAFDNYYVIDRRQRRILIHKGFRFFGQAELFCQAHEILGIALKAEPKTHRHRIIGWRFTPILLMNERRDVALSSWGDGLSCEKLPGYNLTIRRWAAALQCKYVQCPEARAFDWRANIGHTSLKP